MIGLPARAAGTESGIGPSVWLARYVVVSQADYAEAYEIAAGLPVRITSTRDVDTLRTRATFEVSEHDADGGLRDLVLGREPGTRFLDGQGLAGLFAGEDGRWWPAGAWPAWTLEAAC